MALKISVLICTYNRPQLLAKALDGLLNKTIEPPDEVVLVNGGGKATDDAVSPFLGSGSPLRIINTINVSLARSQNVGLKECHGDFIALTDDDAIVAPDWCAMIRKVFEEHPEASAVGGPVQTLYPDNLLARLAHFSTFTEPDHGSFVRTIAGVNICYRRSAIDLVGELDETLVSSEEVDYNWRLVRAGAKYGGIRV
jgi:GT2 family glycosyltransferase